jgi:AraC family transcriptional regulator
MAVKSELERVGLHPIVVELGEVVIDEKEVPTETLTRFAASLKALGFELIDDKQSRLIEKIKTIIIQNVHYNHEQPKIKFSELLARQLHHDYSYLSNLFSQVEGVTIEQFIINQKIEKVKELIIYDDLSISQIAFDLGYSSTAHLSSQFKRVTGLTPTEFRSLGGRGRKSLDDVGSK